MSKNRIEAEDLEALYDLAWGQFKEDRDAVKEIYEKLREHVFDHPTSRFEENGDTLAKYAELMVKQTSQVVELIKLAHKKHQKDGALNEDDLKFIHEEIRNKNGS